MAERIIQKPESALVSREFLTGKEKMLMDVMRKEKYLLEMGRALFDAAKNNNIELVKKEAARITENEKHSGIGLNSLVYKNLANNLEPLIQGIIEKKDYPKVNLNTLKTLVELGFDLKGAERNDGCGLVTTAIIAGHGFDVVKFLVNEGCSTTKSNVKKDSNLGHCPITAAAEHGRIEIVKYLLDEHKVDINLGMPKQLKSEVTHDVDADIYISTGGMSAIYCAAEWQRWDIVEFLLEKKATLYHSKAPDPSSNEYHESGIEWKVIEDAGQDIDEHFLK